MLGVAVALLLLAGGAAAFVVLNQPEDISNPDVEFREEPAADARGGARARGDAEAGQEASSVRKIDRFIWAHYGYTRDRRRYLPVKNPPHPPFREVWQYQGSVLLEFPPVIGGKRLYLLNDSGRLLQHPQEHGRRPLEQEARRARGGLSRLRGRHGLRRAAPAGEGAARAPTAAAWSRSTARPARCAGAASWRAAASPRR